MRRYGASKRAYRMATGGGPPPPKRPFKLPATKRRVTFSRLKALLQMLVRRFGKNARTQYLARIIAQYAFPGLPPLVFDRAWHEAK